MTSGTSSEAASYCRRCRAAVSRYPASRETTSASGGDGARRIKKKLSGGGGVEPTRSSGCPFVLLLIPFARALPSSWTMMPTGRRGGDQRLPAAAYWRLRSVAVIRSLTEAGSPPAASLPGGLSSRSTTATRVISPVRKAFRNAG